MTPISLTSCAPFATSFRMHTSGWILIFFCILIGWSMAGMSLAVPFGMVLLCSLLIHEAGHMLTATLLHVPVREFGLKLAGAYTRRAYASRRRDEVLIAFSGPAANLAVAIPLWFVPTFGAQLALCNLLLCFINLLPIPASDGSRILRTIRTPGIPGPLAATV